MAMTGAEAMTRRRKPRYEPMLWDGLCGHPSGLRTPYEMEQIARAKMDAMERHPGLEWLRKEDERERERAVGRQR
jgi:hypothetical protein